MTLVLRKAKRKPTRGRPSKSVAYVASRWLPAALHFQHEYMLARLEKLAKLRRVAGSPMRRALERTAKKFHMSVASVRRAIKLFG